MPGYMPVATVLLTTCNIYLEKAEKTMSNLATRTPSHDIEPVFISRWSTKAVGKPADKSALPELLQSANQPSDRLPLSSLVSDGRFAFAWAE